MHDMFLTVLNDFFLSLKHEKKNGLAGLLKESTNLILSEYNIFF